MLPWRYPDKPTECTVDFVNNISEGDWLCSAKYDGWRMPIYSDGHKRACLFTGTGNRMQKVPPAIISEIGQICEQLPPMSVLDSEFVGPRGGHPPRVFLFDVLAFNGKWLTNVEFQNRWAIIQSVVAPNLQGSVSIAETVARNFEDYFNQLKHIWYNSGCALLDLCEGVVLKRKTGTLSLSPRSNVKSAHQFKLKYRDVRSKRH